MAQINRLYQKMCAFTVFRDLWELPLLQRFGEYASAPVRSPEKLRAYGAFVAEIYEGGASLTDCVRREVLEHENLYVRAIGEGREPSVHVAEAAHRELAVLSRFAELSADDFVADLGVDFALPRFASSEIDLAAEYESRLSNIGRYGYGMFASRAMFSVTEDGEIEPIVSADRITLDRFIGYETERARVLHNTEMLLEGRPAANVLLYGDAGTGKSSTVKAVVNHFFDRGLRLIELRKNQLLLLPKVMEKISHNPLKFIIFIDDLSFNRNDDSFSMLKATLEGSAAAVAKNAVIYATSNRRHIVKESFADREGSDVHRNDTVQETLSLSERFGMTVLFAKPEKRLYLEIVRELAARHGIEKPSAELDTAAEAFALARGYRSARCAEQFIESLM